MNLRFFGENHKNLLTFTSSLVHVYSYLFIHTLQDTAREAIPFCAPAVYSLFRSQIFSRV